MMSKNIKLPAGIKVVDGRLSSYIRTSSLLITDNSSVAWDFIYKKASVIFYKPAVDYWHIREPFLIDCCAKNDFELSSKILNFKERRVPIDEDFFKYRDKNNCERVFELVQ